MATRETYPKRYDSDAIAELWGPDQKPSYCELDNYPMHDHDYVVLDNLGFVVECDKNV